MNKHSMRMLGAATAVLGLVATVTPAHADVKCRATITKASASLTQAIAKILQSCEAGVQSGKITGPCPDSGSAGKITAAEGKLDAALAKACTNSTGEFGYGRCPNETGSDGSPCSSILINNVTDEGTCLKCLANHNATELVHSVLYGHLIPPGGNKDVAKCQSTVGKGTVAYYNAASKLLAKCQASLLKGKVLACPDAKTAASVAAAKAKNDAGIAKACCGPNGVCGGDAKCDVTAPHTICNGGTNDMQPCDVDSACPGGACAGGSAGDGCQADRDCGRCRGSTTPDEDCTASGQCQSSPANCDTSEPRQCVGGTNAGVPCTVGSQCPGGSCSSRCVGGTNADAVCTTDSECPGSVCQTGTCTGGTKDGNPCTSNANCPAIGGGTCVGTTGLCVGSDDLSPVATIGAPVPCPGITTNGTPIVQTGVTGDTLEACVDGQAAGRANCQDAAGAPFGHGGIIPTACVDLVPGCAIGGGTQQVTVNLVSANPLGGVTISLGYSGVSFPGSGDVSASSRIVNDQVGTNAYNDAEDALTLSTASGTLFGNLNAGALYEVTFDKCGGAVTPANFGCIVRSASDPSGVAVLDGVSCTVAVP